MQVIWRLLQAPGAASSGALGAPTPSAGRLPGAGGGFPGAGGRRVGRAAGAGGSNPRRPPGTACPLSTGRLSPALQPPVSHPRLAPAVLGSVGSPASEPAQAVNSAHGGAVKHFLLADLLLDDGLRQHLNLVL